MHIEKIDTAETITNKAGKVCLTWVKKKIKLAIQEFIYKCETDSWSFSHYESKVIRSLR